VDVETNRGPVDEALLEKTEERVDDETRFCTVITFRHRDDGSLAAQYLRPGWGDGTWKKVNEFDRKVDPEELILIEVDGVRSMRRADELVHKFGQIDNENEFTTWEEFYLPGIEKPVHREPHVRAKKAPAAAAGAVGSFR
jgi:hypothetical protein